MRLLKAFLPLDHNIYFLSDDHEGNKAQYTAALDRTVERILGDSLAFVVHGGDLCEALDIHHKFYTPEMLTKDKRGNPTTAGRQVLNQVARYNPIAARFLLALLGNHDRRASSHFDILETFLDGINRPEIYGGYTAKLSIYDLQGNFLYKIFYFHGRTLGNSRAGSERQREANQAEQLKRMLAPLASDCCIMATAHIHRLQVVLPLKQLCLTDDGEELQQSYVDIIQQGDMIPADNRIYMATGTFLKTQLIGEDTYSEMHGYAPNKIGYPILYVRGGRVVDAVEVSI